jgi:hypothetical protein
LLLLYLVLSVFQWLTQRGNEYTSRLLKEHISCFNGKTLSMCLTFMYTHTSFFSIITLIFGSTKSLFYAAYFKGSLFPSCRFPVQDSNKHDCTINRRKCPLTPYQRLRRAQMDSAKMISAVMPTCQGPLVLA